MPLNLGKTFEQKFKEDYLKSFPNALCMRLYDNMSGYYHVSNYADFICYDSERMYMLDCKAHEGSSFPFQAFSQFDGLISLEYIPNLITGIILWLYDKDKVFFIPTISIDKMKRDGIKSFNPDKVPKYKYYYLSIPSVKLRTYMNSDYRVLKDVPGNEMLRDWGNEKK